MRHPHYQTLLLLLLGYQQHVQALAVASLLPPLLLHSWCVLLLQAS
jgi:hypothetical protein